MNDVCAGLEEVSVCVGRTEGKDGVSPVEGVSVESEVLLSEIEVQLIHKQMNKCKSVLTNDKLKHPQWLDH